MSHKLYKKLAEDQKQEAEKILQSLLKIPADCKSAGVIRLVECIVSASIMEMTSITEEKKGS